ncbi:MAG: hypothetical protein JNL13_07975, partial [Chitinophagaceae bacterium]|nr:hypothetical protein [Chitinophagaceae bacterium]
MKRLKLSSLLACMALVLLGTPAFSQYIFTTDGSWTFGSTSPISSPATGTA